MLDEPPRPASSHHGSVASVNAVLARRGQPVPGTRPVMAREDAETLAKIAIQTIYEDALVDWRYIQLTHQVVAIATVLPNGTVTSTTTDTFTLAFETSLGDGVKVNVDLNVRDVDRLRTVIRHALLHAAPPRPYPDWEKPDPDDPWHHIYGPHTYLPTTLWRDTTAAAIATLPGDVLPRLAKVVADANLSVAATASVSARAHLCYTTLGLSAWSNATDSEVTTTARSLDGTGSGWSGHAHRDVTKLEVERVAAEAKDIALRSRGAVRAEPGRYTAILGPAAVGQLMAMTAQAFAGGSPDGPFTSPLPNGRRNKILAQVADARITLRTDPTDPDNGDEAFFDLGFPCGKMTWIDRGILKGLSFGPMDAAERDVTAMNVPWSMQMTGGDSSIAKMIANCERGVYVNRVSGVAITDWHSFTMTGVTRDGCFLIKDGKIHKPIVNFRFYESPILMLTKVLALGPAERVSFGLSSPTSSFYEWPYPPMVMPPLMVRDFNFSSLCDAV